LERRNEDLWPTSKAVIFQNISLFQKLQFCGQESEREIITGSCLFYLFNKSSEETQQVSINMQKR
jgi:hypothetical protein